MLLLQDFLASKKRRAFDSSSGELSAAPEDAADQPARGYFAKLGDQNAFLYASAGKLVLRIGDESCVFADQKTEFGGDGLRTLRVKKGDQAVMRVSYPNPVNPPMELDFTFSEEEDFDFGLFIHNVLSSEDRVKFLIRKWS